MKNQKYHNVETFLKSNRKIVENYENQRYQRKPILTSTHGNWKPKILMTISFSINPRKLISPTIYDSTEYNDNIAEQNN